VTLVPAERLAGATRPCLDDATEQEGGVFRPGRAGEALALGEQRLLRDLVVVEVVGRIGQEGQVLAVALGERPVESPSRREREDAIPVALGPGPAPR